MHKTVSFYESQTVELSLEKAWDYLSETNDLNHYIGLAPVEFKPFTVDNNALVRQSKATTFGFIKTEWSENVFEWVRESFYTIERIYTVGPVLRAIWTIAFEKSGENQTIIHLRGEFVVRNFFGKLVLHAIIFPQLRKTFEYLNEFQEETDKTFITTSKKKSIEVQEKRLDLLCKRISERFPDLAMIKCLRQTILTGEDADVTSMKTYSWAEQNGFNRRKSVELFLLAANAGILNQEWSMMCPNCRVPKGRANTMKQLESTVHCDLCGVDFEVDFDRYIELRFSVHPSIRKTSKEIYCVNGPMDAPHVVSQYRVPPNTKRELEVPELEQQLRWRVLRNNSIVEMNANEQTKMSTLHFTEQTFSSKIIPFSKKVLLHNDTNNEIVLVLEEVEWDRFALTAREATTFQLFRDLFASDVLSVDQQISVGQLTILFTDLKGSTKLYEAIGDGPAYSNVKKHFDFLMNHIQENEGAIVKTIGDSVMAVFTEESNAFNAALAIQNNITLLNENLTQPVQVRIGFHTGSVIAVNANEILDYFGRTVNLAARIQQESIGNDIVLSEIVYKNLLKQKEYKDLASNVQVESFTRQLQGLNSETQLIRVTV